MQKIRFLFLAATLLSTAVTWQRWRADAATLASPPIGTLVALPLLGLWWLWGYRRADFPVWALPLEGALLTVASAQVGGPLGLFGLLYISVGFRSLYGKGAGGLLPTAVWGLAIAVSFLISGSFTLVGSGITGLQTPGVVMNGLVMWLLGWSLRDREGWFERERMLLEERRVEALEKAKALADLNTLKDRLIERVSHEVRTPLSAIRSYSEMLLDYRDADVQEEFLGIIHQESQRLGRLVEDALDLAKIESGRVTWDLVELDLGELAREAGRNYRPLLEKRGLAFYLEVPATLPHVRGDRDRLMQVLDNLLGNALKFTPQGEVRLAVEPRDGSVELHVSDTGIGVPEEERERIFERFHQAGPAVPGRQQGAGLGLAICREIVDRHGGSIHVDARPGGGSVFTLRLPTV